jgi:inositol transport system substrate-binding protein
MAFVADGVQKFDDDHDNVKVIVTDANFDIPTQIASVENLISQGADAIIIKPVDSSSCQPISDMCKEAGIPFIAVVSRVDSPTDCFVGSDNFYAGTLQGEYIAEALGGEGKVALLLGDLGLADAVLRTDGNKEALSKYPGIEIVDEQVASWMRDEGVAKTENWLQSDIGQSINAIISNNDEMAIGASIACQENGRDDILIAGIDALDDALKLIDEGKLAFTVFYDGVTQGYTACQVAVDLINGKQVDKQVMIDFLPVDKSNVADYL